MKAGDYVLWYKNYAPDIHTPTIVKIVKTGQHGSSSVEIDVPVWSGGHCGDNEDPLITSRRFVSRGTLKPLTLREKIKML